MTLPIILACTAIGLLAGVLGAILGLGGGVIVVPALQYVLPLFGHTIPFQEAVAASQFAVLAVGLSGAAAYLQQGLVRARTGYLLSPYTIVGGAIGSFLGLVLPAKIVATVFAFLLLYSAYNLLRGLKRVEAEREPSRWVPPAMTFAGIMSGLLGIGGGTVQVPVMNLLGGLPIRQAIATSTFIMGLTAVANALIYQAGGKLDAHLASAIALGVLVGARAGAALQKRIPDRQLKLFFSALLVFTAAKLLLDYWS